MNDIDEQIKQALSEEDQQFLSADEQAGLFELVGMSFKGKQAWMTWYMWGMGFLVFIVGVYTTTLFMAEENLKTSLGWALVIIACMMALTIIKVISWQQMQKLELMRELKRLEVRLLLKDQ